MTRPTHARLDRAPDVIVLRHRERPQAPVTLTDIDALGRGPGQALTTQVFRTVHEQPEAPTPSGLLYTTDGVYALDDLLAARWTCPEAAALRAVPRGGAQYADPHPATREQAQQAFDRIWTRWREAL